jgi:predicted amidohydrolase
VGKFQKNYDKIVSYTKKAHEVGADVVVFPELSLSGYTLDEKVLKEGSIFLDSVIDPLVKLTRKFDIALIFGSPRIVGGKLRNSAVIVKKKREVLFYDKTHLFRGEKKVFEAGDDFLVFDFKGIKFGVLICYEVGFPEVSRTLALRGAQILIALFAFGKERWKIYDTATKARAIENGSYLVASSTTGKGFMDFIGKSRIVHPSGKVIAEIDDEEGMIEVEMDTSALHQYRYEEIGDSHAYFANRRKDLYRDICQIRGPSEDLP